MFLKLISFQWEEECEYFVQFWKILKHKYTSPIHMGANWELKMRR